MVEAISQMRVRGAPAIGVLAAYGMALAGRHLLGTSTGTSLRDLDAAYVDLALSRPTAVNLRWALDRMMGVARNAVQEDDLGMSLLMEAKSIHGETLESDLNIGSFGADLIDHGSRVLTHCNTGVLATGGFGTALGVIKTAWVQGKIKEIIATETRPRLQGARLTTWELAHFGIPVTLIVDSAAGHLMNLGRIQCVVVGADRISANGDVANKIGTCSLAVLARENKIPFFVAAPFSTVDMTIDSGAEIPIEERPIDEITTDIGSVGSLKGISVLNLAFDTTPSKYITSIITDRGVAQPPYSESLRWMANND